MYLSRNHLCLTTYPSVYQSTHPPIHLSLLSIHPSIHLSFLSFICLSIHLSVSIMSFLYYLSAIYICMYLSSNHLSIHLTTHPSIHLSLYLPSYLSSHLFLVCFGQSCQTLCDPMHCSPPGSSVPGILQARILDWVAMPSSRVSSRPRDQTCVSCIGRRMLDPPKPLGEESSAGSL